MREPHPNGNVNQAVAPTAGSHEAGLQAVSTLERPSEASQEQLAAAGALHSRPEFEGEVLIELKGVHKSFGSKNILRGVDIKIRRGEAVGIIGGSGTGKSTTLRLMAGLLAPDKVRTLWFCALSHACSVRPASSQR